MPVDPELLDDDDPFEVDAGNHAHLFKHGHYGYDDLLDVFACDPIFFPAQLGGAAEWLMVAQTPGEPALVVPLAPPQSGDSSRARPIGIYPATGSLLAAYHRARASQDHDQREESDLDV